MNYNAAALVVMLCGIAVFYCLFLMEPRLLTQHFFILGSIEVVAVSLFIYADMDKRYREVEKRLRKLEADKES